MKNNLFKIKTLLLLALSFIANLGYSQIATISKQDAQMVKQDTAAARLESIKKSLYLQSTGALQTAANATLVEMSKGVDTLNQSLRLQATAALQTAANATLVASKKGIDTLNQYSRLQATAALQTAANATLVEMSKGIDTLNQSLRLQATAALQTAANATLVETSKGVDTTNQSLRAIKLALDSINQGTKIKYVTASISSTNAGTTYNVGGTINGTLTSYTVSVGSGNWEVVGAVMYPTTSSTVCDINLSLFTSTVTTVNDNVVFASTTTFNQRYAGTLHFATQTPFTGSQIYTAREGTGSQVGDQSVYLSSQSGGLIYFVAWANSAFTPPASQTYTFKLFLRKLN